MTAAAMTTDAPSTADAPSADARPRGAALPTLSLLAITLVWGASFVVTKDALAAIPPADFLAERFILATAVLLALRPRALRNLSRTGWRHAVLIGLILSFSYLAQTYGLRSTPASVSGFITGLFVVFTPILSALVLRTRIAPAAWAAAGLALAGLALLSLGAPGGGDPLIGTGELLTVACAIGLAAHITATGAWAKQHDPYALTIVQLGVTGAVSLLIALPSGIARRGGLTLPNRPADWFDLGFTALLCTSAAILVQTYAQRRVSPTRTAVIMTMEPVFAGLAGTLAGDRLPARGYFGVVLVLAAMYLVELRPHRAVERSALTEEDVAPGQTHDPSLRLKHDYADLRGDDARILQLTQAWFATAMTQAGAHSLDVGSSLNLCPGLAMLPLCRTLTLIDHSASNVAGLCSHLGHCDEIWRPYWNVVSPQDRRGTFDEARSWLTDRSLVMHGSVFDLPAAQWDLGTMFFVAESITADHEEFDLALARFLRALRPGAPFATAFMERPQSYEASGAAFPAVAVGFAEIESALAHRSTDLTIHRIGTRPEAPRSGHAGMLLALGRAAG